MSTLFRDLRYGLRVLMKKPGFTIVAAVTLALGIGANSAIFSVVNALLLRPLPYRDSERLVILWTHSPGANVAQDWPSPGQYSAIKSQNTVFEDITITRVGSVNLTGQGAPERIGVLRTSSAMFSLLDVRPALGRVLLPEEDAPGRPPAAILSYGLWQRRFGADPNVIGKAVSLSGRSYTVVGVLPVSFSLSYEIIPSVAAVEQADILLPLPLNAEALNNQGDENYNLLARLKPGATIAQAQAELDAVVRGLEQEFPDTYPRGRGFSMSVRSLLEQIVGDVRPALLVLLGAVGSVLLIACANVANLLLARATAREKEIAIRTAIGASRTRLVRQLLTESVLLALLGGVPGLFIAVWSLEALRWLNPGNIPRLNDVGIDARALAFTFGIAMLTGILFGLVPALRGSQVNLNETLKEGGRTSASAGNHRLGSVLVVAEVALSLVLLIGAGLLIRSFSRVQQVVPGFSPDHLLSMRISLAGTAFAEEARRLDFYRQLGDRIRGLPGVESAGTGSILPLGSGISWGSITIEGHEPTPGESFIQADQRIASEGYFETMKIPLVSGRFFNEQDTKDSTKVAIIDEHMVRQYFHGEDPVGKRIRLGNSDSPWMTIVGVVGDVKQYALDTDSRVALYGPLQQNLSSAMYVVVRTAGDPGALASAITSEARAIEPNLPVFDIKTMEARISESLARRRFAMFALGLFAVVAMVLAMVGIYGVMAYSVTQRTHEIGVRMALGAQTRDVLGMVVRQGMAPAVAGIVIGLVGSLGLTRLMSSLLFGVSATDPLTFLSFSLLLAGVALGACFVPARRATKVDPMVALRYE